MVQCEMCGDEIANPKTVKIEGAELDVCGDCAEFGTEVTQSTSGSTSTKYSTSSSSGKSDTAATSSSGTSSSQSSSRKRRDMFDEMDEVAQDYDRRIREARESTGLSQEDLAGQLNEKASLIRKLERGEVLPSDDVQRKLERALDISLTEGVDTGSVEEGDYETDSSAGTYTLGDVVKRKD